MIIQVIIWNLGLDKGIFFDIQYRIYLWIEILFFIGFGQTYLRCYELFRRNKVTAYLFVFKYFS